MLFQTDHLVHVGQAGFGNGVTLPGQKVKLKQVSFCCCCAWQFSANLTFLAAKPFEHSLALPCSTK